MVYLYARVDSRPKLKTQDVALFVLQSENFYDYNKVVKCEIKFFFHNIYIFYLWSHFFRIAWFFFHNVLEGYKVIWQKKCNIELVS